VQVALKAVKTSIDMWNRNFKDYIVDTKGFYKAIANTRIDLHKEFSLVLQVETQTTKAIIEVT
jgi:hypothetical protein